MKMLDKNGISDELKSIIENTNDLMFVKNREFVYVASSKNYALDCVRCNRVEDVIGKTDFELFEDQSIAARYRADDEALFASGKTMVEFQEVYPDRNGKKHYCKTTKYLLHDNEGNPIAIFGQYHDIGEQLEAEITRRGDINLYVAEALSKSFFAANYADLKTHKYVTIRAMDYARKMVEKCETIEQAFEAFIRTLVKPEFQEKMYEFCNTDTIAKRVKGRRQIDCEYLSTVAKGWCRASFFPTEWDEHGEVTHVLFAVSSIDEDKSKELEESIANKRDIETIFDEVPGGIILYRWDGNELKILKISKHYQELYGDSMLNDTNTPDFVRVHPDDVKKYQKAIEIALTKTHHLEYVFRAWAKKLNRYVWTQINAISKPQKDGTSLVYAIYTDVTLQKEAELEIEKKQASLEAALDASNQLCCEYDPQEHSLDCFTDNNFFHIPVPLYNYPECLKNYNFVHPDDIERFIATAHMADDGTSSHCDVRAKRDGVYRWYACRFEPFYDPEKERKVSILTIIDATLRMSSIEEYEDRIQLYANLYKDSLSFSRVNLTKNTYELERAGDETLKELIESHTDLNQLMMEASSLVVGESDQKKYRNTFSRDCLLKAFEKGQSSIKMEHMMRISPTHIEWVESGFDLMKHPITGDIVGICHAKSQNETQISRIMLNGALKKDYLIAGLIYADTGEYYLYENESEEFFVHKQNYWTKVITRLSSIARDSEREEICRNMTKEQVISVLAKKDEFNYAFYGFYQGLEYRMEASYHYVDKEHGLLLGTLRNITDTSLYQKYKHESEHDSLTGLFNRKQVFKACRELLISHPNEQFVMLHVDVRHFHLYNTFFGEDAGDKLLCEIARELQKIAKDYDYIAYGRIESDVFCVFFPIRQGVFEKHVLSCVDELNAYSPDFPLKMAIGAYWVTDPTMHIEAMFSRATIAAKSHTDDMFGLVSRYDEEMDQNLKDTQQITSEMTGAIEQEQFQVYLQPKYSLRSDKMVGAEALVRWKHPELGMISPGKFIRAFEQNGFIANLDRYMWEHVCQILRRWKDEGKPLYPVSVNISRVSMYSHATVPFLKSLIEKYQISPKYLELELTESAYMDDPEDLKRMLKELQEYGFHILMDDFGSGYSSLNTLRDLPVNVLKLDMKFLSTEQDGDERGNAVLSSVVRMSKLLNLPIVAEGVETQEQADYLRSIGCEYVQGFLYAKPMATVDYEQLLKESGNNESITEEPVSPAEADVVLEEPFLSLGVLEYDKERFAYLRTNKRFLKEFDLIENLKPASKIFREHLDENSYRILIQAFANCATKKKDTVCALQWIDDKGKIRKYHGYVHYHGNVGNYADLVVTFMNVTETDRIGFEDLEEVDVHNGTEVSTDTTNAIVRALDNTGVRTFMYYPQTKTITVPEKACKAYHCKAVYENMPQSFADDFVYREDHHNFNEMYYAIDRGGKTATAIFHSQDLNFCHHVTLTTVSWLKNGQPKEAVGIIEDMSDTYKNEKLVSQLKNELSNQSINDEVEDALKTMATSIGNQYFAVYYILLETHEYICFQERMEGVLSMIGEKGLCEPAWNQYINNCVDERDQKGMWEFVETSTLAQRIGNKSSISYTYRRIGIGWTRGQLIVGKRDEDGKPLSVIYTVSDINEEMETKLLKEKAEQEALHDSLSTLWNRKAFDQFKLNPNMKRNNVALLVFDIDRFKGINDQFGHEIGDKVIVEVAQKLKAILHANDLPFRMGGDEFAILLQNYNVSSWKTICKKIETFHIDLAKCFPPEMTVTISAGVCTNENGYCDEMYELADKAMYNTKINGRSGCSLVDMKGKLLEEWHDQSSTLRKGEILEKNSTVTWQLDKPKKEGLKYHMYGDELFCAFVGLDRTASAEQLYQAWKERIAEDNFDIVRKASQLAIVDGKVEVVFAWNHPIKGLIQLRCRVYLEAETEDYYTFVGYTHIITGTHVVTMEDIDSKVKNALEELFYANFYIRLVDNSFKIYKAQDYMIDMLGSSKNAMDFINSYIQYRVGEDSKETMTEFFDLTTIKQRLKNQSLISADYVDNKMGLLRAKFIVVDRDENGDVETVSLVVEDAN